MVKKWLSKTTEKIQLKKKRKKKHNDQEERKLMRQAEQKPEKDRGSK
jgi:hypothetical protein